ncbi:MAG: site-specific integrase [Castellaniella sp.]|nr:site-specific integrase [Castellaniella sp.]
MASITKRGPHQWRADVRIKGHPRDSQTFETKAAAQAWADETEAAMARHTYISPAPLRRKTLGDVVQLYCDQGATKSRNADKARAGLNPWKADTTPLATRLLSDLTPALLLDWLDGERDRGLTDDSIRRYVMSLRAALKFSEPRWSLPSLSHLTDPLLTELAIGAGRERRLTTDEEALLMTAARAYSPTVHAIINLAIETGMRRGELAGLPWSSVLLDQHFVRLDISKNGSGREIPLSIRAEQILRALPRDSVGSVFSLTSADSITKAFVRICSRAGIKNLRFHDLRHEAASRIAPHVPATTLAKIFGWKTLQMALRYYNPSAPELVSAIRGAETARAAA